MGSIVDNRLPFFDKSSFQQNINCPLLFPCFVVLNMQEIIQMSTQHTQNTQQVTQRKSNKLQQIYKKRSLGMFVN
jgi:hypothetical protein